LHIKVSVLSEHLTEENMHVLKDKELMKEVAVTIQGQPEKDVLVINSERLTKLDQKDMLREKDNKEQELSQHIETSKSFEINL